MKKGIQIFCTFMAVVSAGLFATVMVLASKLPNRFNVVEGSRLHLPLAETVLQLQQQPREVTSTSGARSGQAYKTTIKLFGLIPIKEVTVQMVAKMTVIPCGTPFGIKMYTDGVLVVGLSDVDTAIGAYNPAQAAGIKVGDVLVCIAGEAMKTTEQVAQLVEKSGGHTMTVRIRRDNIEFDIRFTPAYSQTEGRYKAGMWVRDSSAGIGTLTFYDPSSQYFAGLGHAICDVDTKEILPISAGEIVPAKIYSVAKGTVGTPGELRGGFESGLLGDLFLNAETGIYGKLSTLPMTDTEAVPIAMKQDIKAGYAQILSTVDGTTPKLYDIRIDQITYTNAATTRHMVITITDPALLAITGGIVQGMSGSPILQNGALVGAVTHVLVNDPTKGYAIFAETMLKTMDALEARSQNTAA